MLINKKDEEMERKSFKGFGLLILIMGLFSPMIYAEDAGSPVVLIAALDAGPVLTPTTVVNETTEPLSVKPDAEKSVNALPPLETSDLQTLQKSIDDMKSELEKMKKDLSKKQNAADPNKKFSCKPGGQMLLTGVNVSQNDRSKDLYSDIQNVYGFQDLRLNASGNGYGGIRYMFEMAFQNKDIAFKDVDITVPDIPIWGDLRMGHFRVESGMEFLESSFDTTFTDRTAISNTFRADRHLGIGSIHYFNNKNIRWFSGVFAGKTLDTAKGAYAYQDSSDLILNTRISGVPVYRECNGQLCEVLHFGASYYWCDPDYEQNQEYQLRTRPTGWLFEQPRVLTGKIPVDTMDSYSVAQIEAAWQRGRFGIQTEYFYGHYKNYGEAQGAYLLGRFMLNEGAYRKYNKDRGVFGNTNVPQNLRIVDYDNGFRCFEGFGVFELASMVGWSDLNNLETVSGSIYGDYCEFVNGINWYWNEQTRCAFFWTHAIADSAKYGNPPKEDSITDSFVFQFRIKF